MKVKEIYYQIQNENFSYEEILQFLNDEEHYKKLLQNLEKKCYSIRLYRLSNLKYNSCEIVPPNCSITSKTKREWTAKKLYKLSMINSENNYIISNESLTEEDKKYGKYNICINEYECIRIFDILRNHNLLYNLNLPQKKVYEIAYAVCQYIHENANDKKQFNDIDNKNYHNDFLKDIDCFIYKQIENIFCNPIGAYLLSIIKGNKHLESADIVESLRINEFLSPEDINEYIRCLVLLKLPYDVKIPLRH